jgi:hypothetical protein
MDEKQLRKLLQERNEKAWLEFKGKLKLYQADGKLVEKQRDELLKDILGLANGNSHTIRQTKYLIIGAEDKDFDAQGMRVLRNIDYKVPSQSDLAKWLQSASSTAVAGLECEMLLFQCVNLYVITIPPTFNLHETTRELITSNNGTFQKHTVFMRQDEHIVPASVQDGIAIQSLKHLYRQEIANPPSSWIGAATGAIAAFFVGKARITFTTNQVTQPISDTAQMIAFIVIGIIVGAEFGWLIKTARETRYDWRYMTIKQKFFLVIVLLALATGIGFIFLR